MTAHVGFPTLRLIRWSIGEMDAQGMKAGDLIELIAEEAYDKLGLH